MLLILMVSVEGTRARPDWALRESVGCLRGRWTDTVSPSVTITEQRPPLAG